MAAILFTTADDNPEKSNIVRAIEQMLLEIDRRTDAALAATAPEEDDEEVTWTEQA